jgi:hypothetical protein
MILLEKISQIAELVCETAAELNQRETDILKWVHAEISRREREVLIGLGKWTADDEKDWRKSTKCKWVPENAVEYKGS